ncbi:30855_t:CDS:2 [Gigaspora margarita]|uniref:30855_t:CDS:1 n=1 Tax=Gigaspora margarita TaxID=4874 RepID=A0ABN7VEZ2_GIGMA|nr:30855_t:CDS:2 [Gigaspora margarita]
MICFRIISCLINMKFFRSIDEGFQIPKGWAFPANTKFDKLTAHEMHLELKKFAQFREIDNKDIPQVSTIHN